MNDLSSLPLREPDSQPGCLLRLSASEGALLVTEAAALRLTSVHVQTLKKVASPETVSFTREVPHLDAAARAHLDPRGVVREGEVVKPGDLLVGAVLTRGAEVRDVSLRVPPSVHGRVTAVRVQTESVEIDLRDERPLRVGDQLALSDGEPRVVSAIVPDLGGEDLSWPGAFGMQRVHKVACAEDVMEARSIGPYSLVTQQPLRAQRGQLVELATRQALSARGAEWIVHELMTVRCDDVAGRVHAYEMIVRGGGTIRATTPESARVILANLEALGLLVEALESGGQRLRFATDADVRARSRGIVTDPRTIVLETLRAVPGGLFCERVFGPVRDDHCGCGTKRDRGTVCERCGVEATQALVRRSRFGHVELASPVLHPWLFEHVALLLGVDVDEISDVLYQKRMLGGGEATSLLRTGAHEMRRGLEAVDLAAVAREPGARGALAQALIAARVPATSFVFDAWPVLPPDLRPLVQLPDGKFATSDLNDLYREVVGRNARMRRLIELAAPLPLQQDEAVAIQRRVDALVENGLRQPQKRDAERRVLRSLASMVIGAQGHPATTHAGKRVDYCGRAGVVAREVDVGSILMPRGMAREMFRPWVYGRLETDGHIETIRAAKALIDALDPRAEDALDRVVRERPVIAVNGAAVAAFEILLWDEAVFGLASQAIEQLSLDPLHPMLTVHLPLDDRSVTEARDLLGLEATPAPLDPEEFGWLGELATGGTRDALVEAALRRAVDPILDSVSRSLLGRPPDA